MTAVTPPRSFADRVREHMKTQGLSIKGLARRMDPENVERARRNLHRWLDEGISPNRQSRREIADALGVDAPSLDGDDDEESDPVKDLMRALERWVDDKFARSIS